MLQMLQSFPGVAGLQCLRMLQYCRSLKMLLECCRVRFLEKVFKCCRNTKCCNAAEPTDVAVLSMSWVSFHLDYYAHHVKLNILGSSRQFPRGYFHIRWSRGLAPKFASEVLVGAPNFASKNISDKYPKFCPLNFRYDPKIGISFPTFLSCGDRTCQVFLSY